MSREAKAIHLAAGEGTRLRPYTEDTPKPMVELGGKSLLERNLKTLEEIGIDSQVIVTGYKPDSIESLGYGTIHNPIYDKTDMVYSLFCARDEFPRDRDLVISYGDIIYERSVAESLLECGAPVCVVTDDRWRELWELRFEHPLEDAETLSVTEHNKIEEIGEPADSYEDVEGQYIGLIKIRADHLEEFEAVYDEISGGGPGLERDSVEMTHFLQYLIDLGWKIRSVSVENGWLEVDTVDDLEVYRELYEADELDNFVEL